MPSRVCLAVSWPFNITSFVASDVSTAGKATQFRGSLASTTFREAQYTALRRYVGIMLEAFAAIEP